MPSATWVCFDCRAAVRRLRFASFGATRVACPHCRADCRYLGYHLRVPPRSDVKRWADLRMTWRRLRLAQEQQNHHRRIDQQRSLVQQIAALESRPANDGRAQTIRSLRKRLDAL